MKLAERVREPAMMALEMIRLSKHVAISNVHGHTKTTGATTSLGAPELVSDEILHSLFFCELQAHSRVDRTRSWKSSLTVRHGFEA